MLSTSSNAAGTVEWTSQTMEAFRNLCGQLSSSVCLFVPCVSDVFVLECDACSTGIGAVLSMRRDDGLQPVAFFSHQLKGPQGHYSAQELEGLALYESITHFSFYLYRKRFTVITDHQALVTLMTAKQKNRRLDNWSMKLSEYQFDVIYRKGSENIAADSLSRCYGRDEVYADREHQQRKEGEDVGQPT